ncbi:very-long-chain (3R)-3-hydroxyacyl-CoA dehydratase 4 isoform X2 [Callithrix jacchus]
MLWDGLQRVQKARKSPRGINFHKACNELSTQRLGTCNQGLVSPLGTRAASQPCARLCSRSAAETSGTSLSSLAQHSMVDTFYAIGFVMRLCQSVSLLELLHIYVGIEYNHLLPRFLQLTERIIILFVVITSQEEVQEKYVVCVLFIFWNLLDMVRYTYSMLSVIGISYAVLTWLSQTLWMPIYPLCVLAEAFAIYQSLPYFESFGTYSTKLPFDLPIYFPYVLKIYLMMLFIGMYFTYSHLYSERRDLLGIFPIKKKKM